MREKLLSKSKSLSDLLIAVPCRPGGGIHPDLVLWLLQQAYYGASISCVQASPVDRCRNIIADQFLKTEKEYLLMVDDDVIPDDEVSFKLRYAGKPVIGAVCYAWRDVGLYPLLLYKNTERTWVPGSRERVQMEMDEHGIVRVDATGAGCLLIHREVLEKIDRPFFKTIPDGMGEDVYFCENARKHGFEIYVHTKATTDHFVRIGLGGVAKFVAEQIELSKGA